MAAQLASGSHGDLVGFGGDVTEAFGTVTPDDARLAAEAAFRAMFEQSAVGMAHVGIDGTWIRVNERLCQMLGYTSAELQALSFREITHPDDRAASVAQMHRMLDGESDTYLCEKRYMRKDSQVIWVNLNSAIVRDTDGAPLYFVTVLEDITEQKLARAAQQLSEAKYSSIFRTSPDSVTINRLSDGLYLECNQGFTHVFGYLPCDVEGKTSLDLSLWEDPVDRARYIDLLRATGVTSNFETRLRRKDGTIATVLISARVIDIDDVPCALAITRDISDRKATEEALRASEAKYRAIAESISDVVWVLDPHTLRFLYVSPSVTALRGYTPEEVLAEPMDAALTPEGSTAIRATIAKRLADLRNGVLPPSHRFTQDVEQPCKDGSTVWTEVVTTYHHVTETDTWEVHGVTRDITERKREEIYEQVGRNIVRIIDETTDTHDALTRVIETLRTTLGLEAAGIRLKNGDEFPYFVSAGYPAGFIEVEDELVVRDESGRPVMVDGVIELACTCGLVLSGQHTAMQTPCGSVWTNDSSVFLESLSGDDPRQRPRDHCVEEGYRSIALIPIPQTGGNVGLIHLNDRRPGRFDARSIELLEGLAVHLGSCLARRRTQQDLEDRERWLGQSQRVAHLGHFVFDIASGQLDGSPSLYSVLGTDDQSLHDREGWLAVVHPDDRGHMKGYLERKRDLGDAEIDVQYRVIRPVDSQLRWVHTVGQIEFTDDGTARAMYGIAQDITERHDAEEQLARSLDSMIDVVGRVVELRDPYTGAHQVRVAELATRIASELGVPASRIEDIRVASVIHDLGKVAVPAEILSKPGTLSAAEFALIQRHAQTGYEIVSAANTKDEIAEMVYQHHERCDGSGYPQGLNADDILPGSKILAVADVVEAMVSHRPYRPGLGVEAALAEIQRGAGSVYDAAVCDACLRVFREHDFVFTAV